MKIMHLHQIALSMQDDEGYALPSREVLVATDSPDPERAREVAEAARGLLIPRDMGPYVIVDTEED